METKLRNPKWSDDMKDAEFTIIDQKAQLDRKLLLSRLTRVGSITSQNLIKRLDIFSIQGAFLQHRASFVLDPWKVEWKSIKRVPRSQIGKGSFAIVHKVVWLGKDFAEKAFPFPENEIFRKEVSFLAGLSHPNILPLFCYATCSHYCSIVMELMDDDLHSLMRNRLGPKTSLDPPFELLEAINIMLQVAEGMKYLHQNKVMHRDLKAGNILVKCIDGHVYAKVGDFGVSKTTESRCTDSNQTMDVGTTRWMAPELFTEESHDASPSVARESDISLKYPFTVDIYSFGMVCYEILTGCIPFFNCPSMRDLRKRIKDGLRPDIPEQCPEQLSTLIQACYHPNPAERPSFRKICVELRHLMWSLMVDPTL
jgi:serine/threonine protein kinase